MAEWSACDEPPNHEIITLWFFTGKKKGPMLKSETMEHLLRSHEIRSTFKNVTHGAAIRENGMEPPQNIKNRTSDLVILYIWVHS